MSRPWGVVRWCVLCGGWESSVPTGHCGHHVVVSSEDLAGERSCAVLVVSWCVAELGVVRVVWCGRLFTLCVPRFGSVAQVQVHAREEMHLAHVHSNHMHHMYRLRGMSPPCRRFVWPHSRFRAEDGRWCARPLICM